MDHTEPRHIGTPAKVVLGLLMAIMVGIGGAGAYGTYTNMSSKFASGTAIGITAAGEGLAAVIALAILCFTLLQQPAPRSLHLGLWALPMTAAVTGMVVADNLKELAVYAMTPMAMSISGEAIGAISRAIVVRTTGEDIEAKHRNTHTVRMFTYHSARAQRHPNKLVRRISQRAMWRIARKIGDRDLVLADALTTGYRDQVASGADQALLALLTGAPAQTPELTTAPAPESPKESPKERAFPQVKVILSNRAAPVDGPKEMLPAPRETVEDTVETTEESPEAAEDTTETIDAQIVEEAPADTEPVLEVEILSSVSDLSEAAQRQAQFAALWYASQKSEPPIPTKAEFCRQYGIQAPYLSKALNKFPEQAVVA